MEKGHKEMTLDEAIVHCEDVAERLTKTCSLNDQACGREHLQLAKWLKDLRDIKSIIHDGKIMNEYKVVKINNIFRHGYEI